jgi:hypothetical protein
MDRSGQEVDLAGKAVDRLGCGLGNNAWTIRGATRLWEVGHHGRGNSEMSDENPMVKTRPTD